MGYELAGACILRLNVCKSRSSARYSAEPVSYVRPLRLRDRVRPVYRWTRAALAAAIWSWRYNRGPEVTFVAPARGTAVEIVYADGGGRGVGWAKVAASLATALSRSATARARPSPKRGARPASTTRSSGRCSRSSGRAGGSPKRAVAAGPARGPRSCDAAGARKVSMELRTVQALILAQMEKRRPPDLAPIDGVVLRRDGEVGEIAEAGQVLFRIGVLKPLQVGGRGDEEDILRVPVGQTVLLRTDASREAPRRHRARDHAHGRSRGQNLPHQGGAARRYAAPSPA